jgi:hypothetical protein
LLPFALLGVWSFLFQGTMRSIISTIPLVLVFCLLLATFLACYLLNTLYIMPHLDWFLPTISELGDRPPASSIFSFGFAIGSFAIGWVVFCRFKDLHHVLPIERYQNANRVACTFGLLFCLALLFVCTFQSNSVPYVHYTAALCLFLFATAYVWIQAVISRRLSVFRSWSLSVGLMRLRFFLAVVQTLGFLGIIAFAVIWEVLESGSEARFWWNFVALCEYVTALGLGLFLLTLVPEFRYLNVQFIVDDTFRADLTSVNDSLRLIS